MSGGQTGLSKQVVDLSKDVQVVLSAFEVQGPEVAAGIAEKLVQEEVSDLPSAPEVLAMIQATGRWLAHSDALMQEADLAHAEELSDDPAFREKRQAAVKSLRALLMELNSAITGAYGKTGCGRLGLSGKTPLSPFPLVQYANKAAQLFRNVNMGAPINRWSSVDLNASADDLETAISVLEASLSDVEREKREANQTRTHRDETFSECKRIFNAATGIFTGYAVLGGRKDIADRLKPTLRKRSNGGGGEDEDSGDNGGDV